MTTPSPEKKRGRVISTTLLFSEQCFTLLKNAVSVATPNLDGGAEHDYRKFYEAPSTVSDDDDSDSHRDDDGSSESERSTASDKEDEKRGNGRGGGEGGKKGTPVMNDSLASSGGAPPVMSSSLGVPKKQAKQTKPQLAELQIQKYFDDTPVAIFRLPTDPDDDPPAAREQDDVIQRFVEFPSGLVANVKPQFIAVQHFQELLQNRRPQNQSAPAVVVLFIRSGRFAGAVFATDGTCLQHTTSARYTVRRGQGKAQSAQDGNRKAVSMGAQLRRHGEVQLQNDIATALMAWKALIDAAAFVLVSVPKTMRHVLFENFNSPLRRDDPRICRVPMDLGRPSFESVCMIHAVLTRVVVREYTVIVPIANRRGNENDHDGMVVEPIMRTEPHVSEQSESDPDMLPMTALHIAAQSGDLQGIAGALSDQPGEQDQAGGEFFMTPLHYAAEAGQAEAVKLLLETGGADPTKIDSRGRVPYFLAEEESVRDTFRAMRAILGEAYCDWDAGAKVGPPLTEEEMARKREKLAEKRRKKKAKQKERKQVELRQKEEAEQSLNEQRLNEAAEPPKGKIGAECDFCKTLCVGKKRAEMFKRLGFSYCSTDCVQKHKRQLAANAAMARMG
jgi:hypothetical protein